MSRKWTHRILISALLALNFHTSAKDITFNETRMRERLRSIPTNMTYYSLTNFPKASIEALSDELKAKSKRLVDITNKNISLKPAITSTKMDAIVAFIERLKPILPNYFEEHSSAYVHSASELQASIMAYKSGRIYIIFNDRASVSGGFKRFTRSIEYNSEKAHAHLVIRKKSKETKLRDIISELKIQVALKDTSSILNFLDSDVYTQKTDGQYEHAIAIEEELYEGDLSALIKNYGTLDDVIDIFHQMAKAVGEMHSARYLHRDIKPDNFLYRRVDGKIQIVLADFGLAEFKHSSGRGEAVCGTSGFIDPGTCVSSTEEDGLAFHHFREGKKADVFSLGMSFVEILLGSKSRLQRETEKINDLVFDSEGAEKKRIAEALSKFKALHAEHFPEKNKQGKKDTLFRLREIIWKMIHPEVENRIEIREVVKRLSKLKEV